MEPGVRCTMRGFQYHCLDWHVHQATHGLWWDHLRAPYSSPLVSLDTLWPGGGD